MTFQEAYSFLLSLSNLPRKEYMRDPRSCGIYVKRLQFFLDTLGNPEQQIPHYIHVAGTSGKGSVTSYLHSLLHADGRAVGSTYSPHPTSILERWRYGNRYMYQREFVALISRIKPALDTYIQTSPYDMLSFFEVAEAIGFLWFVDMQAEWVVLETGCGGRFDSSNCIPHKDIAIITNIGLDHVGVIGNTKMEIAHEKIGIITGPTAVFTMEHDPRIRAQIRAACAQTKSTFTYVKNEAHTRDITPSGTTFSLLGRAYQLQAPGVHQTHNAELCIAVGRFLGIKEKTIHAGLRQTSQPLRMEVLKTTPRIILDAAHNPDKIRSTVETIQAMRLPGALHLVIGCSEDKDVKKMLQLLSTLPIRTIACTRNTSNPFRKVADPAGLAAHVRRFPSKPQTQVFLDPLASLAWTREQASTKDTILVTGSIFLSGELRGQLM